MSRYQFGNHTYDEDIESYGVGVGDILDLLFDLEEQGEIVTNTTTTYNIKNCDSHYSDDDLEDFIELLVENGVIKVVE